MGGIKYAPSEQPPSGATKIGNFIINPNPTGPTSETGYWSTIDPPGGGYTIYLNKAQQGPSIYVPTSDSQLISLTRTISGQDITTVAGCIAYYSGNSDTALVIGQTIVTDGLIYYLDAGNTSSYPQSGTTWFNIGGSLGNNGTLVNGPTFSSSNGGVITFDGTNDYLQWASDTAITPFFNSWWNLTLRTFEMWVNFSNLNTGGLLGVSSPGYYEAQTFYWISNSRFGINDNSVVSSTGNALSTNTWYNVVWLRNAQSSHTLYLNGTLIGSNSSFMSITDTDTDWGATFMSNKQGTAPIVRFYNRKLTASEILQNYNAQKGRFGL